MDDFLRDGIVTLAPLSDDVLGVSGSESLRFDGDMNLERGSMEDCLAGVAIGDVVDVMFLEDVAKKFQF